MTAAPTTAADFLVPFILSAGAWASSGGGPLEYEYGLVRSDGGRTVYARGVTGTTFAVGLLPHQATTTVLYACASDPAAGGVEACEQAAVQTGPVPPGFTVDVSSVQASLDAAAATGDTGAVLAAARSAAALSGLPGGAGAASAAVEALAGALAAGGGANISPGDAMALIAALGDLLGAAVGGADGPAGVAWGTATMALDTAWAALAAAQAGAAAAAAGGPPPPPMLPADLVNALATASAALAALASQSGGHGAAAAAAGAAALDALAGAVVRSAAAGLSLGEPALALVGGAVAAAVVADTPAALAGGALGLGVEGSAPASPASLLGRARPLQTRRVGRGGEEASVVAAAPAAAPAALSASPLATAPLQTTPFIVLPTNLGTLCPVPGCTAGGLVAAFAWVADPSLFLAGAPPLAGPAGEAPAGAATGHLTLTLADAVNPAVSLPAVPGDGRIVVALPAIPPADGSPALPGLWDASAAKACVRRDAFDPSGWVFETYAGVDPASGAALCLVSAPGTVLVIQYAETDGPWYGYGPNPTVIFRVAFPTLDGDPTLFNVGAYRAALLAQLPPGSVVRVIVVVHGDEVGGGVIVQTEVETPLTTAGLTAAIGLEGVMAANDPATLAVWFDPVVYGPARRLTWTVRGRNGESGGKRDNDERGGGRHARVSLSTS